MRALSEVFGGEAGLTLAKAMDLAPGREASERNAKSFKNPEWSYRKYFPLLKELKYGHHAIVVADQITMPKTAGSERLNGITVAS